jgi:5-methyltetrahydropteroyltriglutamate--homocysteine methyltransferase
MFVATADRPLATTITGSLPRPHWYVENLGTRPFLATYNGAIAFREQYRDAVGALIFDQTRAGLDIVSDGEMRFDTDIGGRSWFGYVFDRMAGLAPSDTPATQDVGISRAAFQGRAATPGDIVNEFVATLRPPRIVGPGGPGDAAVRRRLEGRAGAHRQAGEVRVVFRADDRASGAQ